MGSFLSQITPKPISYYVADSVSGLSGKEKKIIERTWAIVKQDQVASGVAILYRLLKKHPEYQQHFQGFKEVPLDSLPNNKRFQAHCTNVIHALNNVIDCLQTNDKELLECILMGLGERHKNRGFKKEHFENLKEVMVDVVSQKLGSRFTPEVADAWSKTIEYAFACIYKGLLE